MTARRARIHRHMIDLEAERGRLLAFAEGSRHPEGGFAWLNADGTADLERPRELWINTRMTYVFAQAGDREQTEHGLQALRYDFRDAEQGACLSHPGEPGAKLAYEHVVFVLAAAGLVDSPLLAEAL